MEDHAETKRGFSVMGLFGRFPNPGRFDDLKAAAANLLALDNFEGARFEFNKTMTQKFALLHNVSLVPGQPGAYEFGAHVGDEKTLLASRIDGVWKVPAAFIVNGEPMHELRGTLIVLGDSGFTDEEAMHWLLTEEESLGVSPIAALQAGRKAEVRRVAQALGF